ncbi:MAG TPA: ribose-phosphate pyrophosphokinase, partial [Chromatiales bacterium]|nr:ribose-phosphate pyrophosphokinase [Chromatiales bacterium]
ASGTTMARCAAACRAAGAVEVHAAATHGVFTGADAKLADAALDSIVVTSSIPPFRLTAPELRERLVVLDAAGLFAEAIRRLHEDGSLVELLEC